MKLEKILHHISLFLCNILFEFSGQIYKFICKKFAFSINSKISFMSSCEKPVLILKVLVTNFCWVKILLAKIFKLSILYFKPLMKL